MLIMMQAVFEDRINLDQSLYRLCLDYVMCISNVRACARACVRACVRTCVRAFACIHVGHYVLGEVGDFCMWFKSY